MKKKKIGIITSIGPDTDYNQKFSDMAENGFNCCQIRIGGGDRFTEEKVAEALKAAEYYGVEFIGYLGGWSAPWEWNFHGGPVTLGLVPPAYRHVRLNELKAQGRDAAKIGVTDLIAHAGFIPENPNEAEYYGFIAAMRSLALDLKERGQYFLFETGQETPVTLLRAIEDIGTGNLGVNLDTANLILYGKGNPVDALDVIGKYVRNTHCKDGLFPTNGRELGLEVPIGEGKANLPEVIKRLDELGYEGPFIIEREISGEQQRIDTFKARDYISDILDKYIEK